MGHGIPFGSMRMGWNGRLRIQHNMRNICFAEELVRIRFCEENCSIPEKKGGRGTG